MAAHVPFIRLGEAVCVSARTLYACHPASVLVCTYTCALALNVCAAAQHYHPPCISQSLSAT